MDCEPESHAFLRPTLTDFYQITMAYGYWKSGKAHETAVFDLFFRRNPFNGEFTVFCGLADCLEFLEKFSFSDSDIDYLKKVLPKNVEHEFFDYLRSLSCKDVKLWAVPEGLVVFPRVPLMIVEGPLAIVQLIETTLLNLVNYASLVCTNAARFRLAAGPKAELLEFGLRRAQGPDGGISASKYCYVGGFDGTSNVLAGKMYNIPVRGTHAHSFVNAFGTLNELSKRLLDSADGSQTSVDFVSLAKHFVDDLCEHSSNIFPKIVRNEVNEGELAAFASYAICFPSSFLALIDTYDAIRAVEEDNGVFFHYYRRSGIVNFCACALALNQLGYRAIGIRVDSGDLAYLSREARRVFVQVGRRYNVEWFAGLKIVASNDIDEDTLHSLKEQDHQINCYGVGTHLVTCQKQPALGCVYKLVELSGKPRIKLSQDVEKMTIPGKKVVYRLFGKDGCAINDLMLLDGETPPAANATFLCRHPFQETTRAYVTPTSVQRLHQLYWSNGVAQPLPSLAETRETVKQNLVSLREDHRRSLNPTPYKVSVSTKLYQFIHSLWLQNAPIGQLE